MSYYFEKKRQDICAGLVQYTQTDTKKNSLKNVNYFPSVLKKKKDARKLYREFSTLHYSVREQPVLSMCA